MWRSSFDHQLLARHVIWEKIWCINGREELFMRSLECYFWYIFFRLRNKNMHSREHINILLLPRVMWCDVLWHVLWFYCVMWCMWCDAVKWSSLDTILYNLQDQPMLWMLMPQWPKQPGRQWSWHCLWILPVSAPKRLVGEHWKMRSVVPQAGMSGSDK